MNKRSKIIICGIIAAVCVSSLYAVIPITSTFIISHIFSIIAIVGICGGLCIYDKGKSRVVAGLSYIYTVVIYGVINIVFSIIACIITLPTVWIFIIHIVVLGIFAIRIISLNIGSDYIYSADEKIKQKHNKFLNEKKNYWK